MSLPAELELPAWKDRALTAEDELRAALRDIADFDLSVTELREELTDARTRLGAELDLWRTKHTAMRAWLKAYVETLEDPSRGGTVIYRREVADKLREILA